VLWTGGGGGDKTMGTRAARVAGEAGEGERRRGRCLTVAQSPPCGPPWGRRHRLLQGAAAAAASASQ
jgi:hypothetical protein